MTPPSSDPYAILGVSSSATDDELRTAYRQQVKRHHPDHNHGSPESALRFAAIQEAYARVKLLRTSAAGPRASTPDGETDHRFDDRIAQMEQELRAARGQREKAMRDAEKARHDARTAAASAGEDRERPTDEELGYISTNDSFTQILDDFADQVSTRFSEVRDAAGERPARARPHSVTDWLDELGSKLAGERRDHDE
jgi:curved DNA-binding protein CbpA